jgi:heterodisulfide reductase subunit C
VGETDVAREGTSVRDEVVVGELNLGFRDEIARHPGGENVRRCFACGTCAAGCPITEIDPEYDCRRIIRQILFGMRDEVLSSPVIWECLVCYRCYVRCPQQVNFTDIMRVLRYLAVKEKHISPEAFGRITEAGRIANGAQRDLVRRIVGGDATALDELESKVKQAIGPGA